MTANTTTTATPARHANTQPVPSELAALGLSYRRLDYWARRGYLHPEHDKPEQAYGSGYPRRWPAEELAVAARMTRLLAAGFTLAAAARWARTAPAGIYIEIGPGLLLGITEPPERAADA